MTVLSPRIRMPRFRMLWFDRRSPIGKAGAEIVRRHQALPRPPMYVILCATVGVLNIVGLVMILSASSVAALSDYGSSWYFFDRQLIWAIGGVIAFVAASSFDYHWWRRAAPWLLGLAGAGLLVVLVPGIGIMVDGSRRWLGAGPIRVQPTEVAKLALLCCGANVLARRADRLHDWRQWTPVLFMLGLLAGLVMLEPDLDSAIVLALIGFALLVVSGVRRRHLAALGSSAMVMVTALAFAAPYRRARMLAFLHPWKDQANTGYQIAQSLIALGSGGVSGVGLGAGRAKWMFLPNAHTDFIFAVIGEELGLVGCLLVLALFAAFGLVGFRVARRAPDRFGTLLAAGVTAWIVGQAAINLGAVVGLLPVSGITLPFLSAGGSSLVITMLGAGILANVARRTPPPARAGAEPALASAQTAKVRREGQ
jgi:cell division protein FtsW